MFDRVACGHRLIHGPLELDLAAAAEARVLGQDGHALRVVDAVGNRVGRKSSKNHRVHGPDARTGQQRNRQLRRHAHVDGHAVALLDPQRLESIGELLHLLVQLRVAEPAHLARFALPNNRGLVAAGSQRMTIDAVVAQVQLAAHKPLGPRLIPLQHLVPGLEPVQIPGHAGPKALRIVNGLLVERLVFLKTLDVSLGAEFRRGREDTKLPKRGVQILIDNSGNGQGRHESVLLGK